MKPPPSPPDVSTWPVSPVTGEVSFSSEDNFLCDLPHPIPDVPTVLQNWGAPSRTEIAPFL